MAQNPQQQNPYGLGNAPQSTAVSTLAHPNKPQNIPTGTTQAPTPGVSNLPQQQVAPLTPQQLQSMNMVSQQSGGTQGFLNAAEQQQQDTINGAGLSPNNPYLAQYFNTAAQPMINQYTQATAPNILQSAAQTGGLGGSGQAEAFKNAQSGLAEGLGNLGAGIYEPAYAQGVQNQQAAAQNAPNLASGQYIPSQQLMQSGQVGQNQAQNVLQTAYNNLYGTAQYPFQELSQLGGALGQAGGGAGSSLQIGAQPGAGGMK